MKEHTYEQVMGALASLKLATMRQELDANLRLAEAKGLSHLEFLRGVLSSEVKGRMESSRRRRLAAAHFPVNRTLEDFDFGFQKSVKKGKIVNLAECRWLESATNLLFQGPAGLGKSHLAIALGLKAVEKGYRVRFYPAEELLEQVYVHAAAGDMDRFMRGFLKNDCVVIDEFAYLPLDAHAGNHLYRLVNSAYERLSLVITTNKGVQEWGEMFQDQAIAQAILDRFLHHCEVFKMRGESYRLKGPQRDGKKEKSGAAGNSSVRV